MEAQERWTTVNDSAVGFLISRGQWVVVAVAVVYVEDGRKHGLGWLNRCRRRTDHTKGTSEGVCATSR